MTEETGWLIEQKTKTSPKWLGENNLNGLGWTRDSLKAIRFARKEDADLYIRLEQMTDSRATEHIWSDK